MKQLSLLAAALFAAQALYAQTGNVGIGTTAPQAQLHTTGSIRMDTLRGPGAPRFVLADSAGKLFTLPPAYPTAAPAAPVVANGCALNTGALSTITVTGMPAAVASSAIRVRVSIAHGYDSDLLVYLQAPNGAVLTLLFHQGGGGDNFTNTIFSDAGATPVPYSTVGAPFSGVYQPSGSLSANCGVVPTVSTFAAIGGGTIVPNGAWTLQVYDIITQDAGMLLDWSISFDGTDPLPYLGGAFFSPGVVPRGIAGGGLANGSIYDSGAGAVGIGTTVPNAPLQLSNALQSRKIVLYEGANNDHQYYGFGINGGTLRYQTDAAGADHVFFSAASSSASTELMRIRGNGNVGVGTGTTVNAKLDVAGTTETDALRINTGGDVKDFAVKNDATGNVGFRKGFRGLGMRYVICTAGCFPSNGANCSGADILGEIKLLGGTSGLPSGWLECNGQLLSINLNQALFALLGTTYGGNGQTTFAVPDLRGSVPVGAGSNSVNTWTQGEQN